jgi:hypothetical protein
MWPRTIRSADSCITRLRGFCHMVLRREDAIHRRMREDELLLSRSKVAEMV